MGPRRPSLLQSLVVLLAVLSLAALLRPGDARAGCGGVQTASPRHERAPGLPPLAIGDSTMLFALPTLAAEGFSVNARGCRQYPEALALLAGLRSANALPRLVVIALGANGSVTNGDISQALAILGAGRVLVLVTPRELGGGSGSDATTVRRAAAAYPGRVHVLDWVAYSAGHGSDWFAPDGLHLTFAGAAAFARFLARALVYDTPPILDISGTGRLTVGTTTRRIAVRLRAVPPTSWLVTGQHRYAGVADYDFSVAGPCAYHLRLLPKLVYSASPGAAVLGDARPSGSRAGPAGTSSVPAAWATWRGPTHEAVSGAWMQDLGPAFPGVPQLTGHAYLLLVLETAAGPTCTSTQARVVEGAAARMLASIRRAAAGRTGS